MGRVCCCCNINKSSLVCDGEIPKRIVEDVATYLQYSNIYGEFSKCEDLLQVVNNIPVKKGIDPQQQLRTQQKKDEQKQQQLHHQQQTLPPPNLIIRNNKQQQQQEEEDYNQQTLPPPNLIIRNNKQQQQQDYNQQTLSPSNLIIRNNKQQQQQDYNQQQQQDYKAPQDGMEKGDIWSNVFNDMFKSSNKSTFFPPSVVETFDFHLHPPPTTTTATIGHGNIDPSSKFPASVMETFDFQLPPPKTMTTTTTGSTVFRNIDPSWKRSDHLSSEDDNHFHSENNFDFSQQTNDLYNSYATHMIFNSKK
jgi:hypothetical protein